jgi:outer membrane protein assembly factor BamB
VETGADKAEVQNRPLLNRIPAADADAKNDVKRIEVPAGKVAQYDWRVFIAAPRELIAVGADCTVEWRFTLPGKADNGEVLLDVAGFHDGKVVLVSEQTARVPKQEPMGRIYTFDIASGRLITFTTVPGGFDAAARLTVDGANNALVSVSAAQVRVYGLTPDARVWTAPLLAPPVVHATVADGAVCVTTAQGVDFADGPNFQAFVREAVGTAPPALHINKAQNVARIFAPVKTTAGQFLLSAVGRHPSGQAWSVPVPKAITIAPVLRGTSVYFLAGQVLYRVNATTGAICWKYTLPLKPDDALTELALVGGELRASGPGLLVRIAERPEPQPDPPPSPKLMWSVPLGGARTPVAPPSFEGPAPGR